MWLDPNLSLRWGPYFHEASEDNARTIDMVIKAKAEGIIQLRTAVERIASIFDIENIDQYVAALEEDKSEHGSTELAMKAAANAFDESGAPKRLDPMNAMHEQGMPKSTPCPPPFPPKK